MSTEGFLGGLERLERLGLGGEGRKGDGKGKGKGEGGFVAFMCSETLWWRCHRRMVSDALVAKGWEVRHLGMKKEGDGIVHHIWDIARVGEDGELVYDGGLGTNE